jgi:hypothetical protein
MPHELNISNRAGVVEQEEEVLEEFQVFLKFAAQSSAKNGVVLSHGRSPRRGGILIQIYGWIHH